MDESAKQKSVKLFAAVLIFVALANGLGGSIFSNYFNEVYHITSVQRGFLEVPRESPGVLCMILVAALGFMGNLWMSVVSNIMVLVGLSVMGLMSPSYGVMLIFLFIQSMGNHLFMPLNDSISMSLAEKGKEGATLGKFKSVTTTGAMIAACMVFVGFRTGVFSFQAKVIRPFMLGCIFSIIAIVLLCVMNRYYKGEETVKNHRLLFRKQYMPYYMTTLAYGCQKRIRIVFAPWVVINLLGQGADTIALLTIAIHFIGSRVSPIIGRLLDRYGVKKMLWLEAGYIAVSFCTLGMIAGMLANGSLAKTGPQTWIVFAAYVFAVLFEQFGMVHSFMMRSIALDKSEVTRTLSVGISVDHIMAIIASPILGLVWDHLGVQYVFYFAAASAVLQLAAAAMVKKQKV